MSLPESKDVEKAALEYLSRNGGAAAQSAIAEALAKRFQLSDRDLNKTIAHRHRPEGESAWKQQLRRIKYAMVQRGQLARAAKRGQWALAK